MKKNGVIIGIIVAILIIIVVGTIFMNLNKTRNIPNTNPEGGETGSFSKGSFTIDDYTINLNSAKDGHPQPNSYFSTSISIIDDEKIESNYNINFSDIIDSNTMPYDSNFNVYEEDIVSINGKDYKYYINNSAWNAILCYTIPNENKDLIIKINGGDVFSSDGVQLKHLAHIDKEFLNSKELAEVLNYTITKQ